MNKKDIIKLARVFREDMDLIDFQPMETTIGNKIIIFRVETEDDNQVVEGYYDTFKDKIMFTVKEVDELTTIDNIDGSMRFTILDFKNHLMNENYTPLDLQTIEEFENVREKYEIGSEQFLQYVCIMLEERYSKSRVIELLEEELHLRGVTFQKNE